MARTINFVFICKNILKLEDLSKITEYLDDAIITEISCIDDWCWSNKISINSNEDIKNSLLNGKICVILLKSKSFANVGVYIEKHGDDFEYDIWINTDEFLDMDSDVVDSKNEFIYNSCYDVFAKIIQTLEIDFKIFAIGTEVVFWYSTSLREMIEKSHNIVSWIIPDIYILSNKYDFYRKKYVV